MRSPPELSSDQLAKTFFELCSERYPSSSKVLAIVNRRFSGLTTEGRIIIISWLRDTVKQVNPEYLYKSMQHRDELFMAIIETLEDLEDQLEEEEERAEKLKRTQQ